MTEMSWWKSAVIYQIYPCSFQDTDGDGVGDLRGIVRRIPYLIELGVDAIWISPIFRSPMADFGYDVSDYIDIDPLFGTLADFDALVAGAHACGIKVLLDFVPNHTSDQHPWFVESAVRAAIRAGTGIFGATPVPAVGCQTTGSLSSAAKRGSSIPQQVNTITTPFCSSSPT